MTIDEINSKCKLEGGSFKAYDSFLMIWTTIYGASSLGVSVDGKGWSTIIPLEQFNAYYVMGD